MAKNSIAIMGRSRLAGELHDLCREKGLYSQLQADAEKVGSFSAATVAVDTAAGSEEEKKRVLQRLDAALSPSSVILTSCLGFSATRIGSWASKPERVVGFATLYPIKGKKVIELLPGLRTQEESLKRAEAFFLGVGKDTVRVKDNGPIFPRILSVIVNEATRALDEGVARAEEIDVAMRLGTNYPLGPLRWADLVGLDEILAVLEGLRRETGDDRYRPAPLLNKMVLAGWTGEASGKGFYEYK
jgi:3-hydroxybutyryl-CoA dehydrogenase